MVAPPSNIFPTSTPELSNKQVSPGNKSQQVSSVHSNYPTAVGMSGQVKAMQEQLFALHDTLIKSDIAQWSSIDKEPAPNSDRFKKGPFAFLQLMLDSSKNTAMPSKSFLQHVEMLKDIGSHSTKEQVPIPDGIWGEHTDNALKAALAISSAVETIAKKLSIKLSLKPQILQVFSKLISDKTVKSARDITLYLKEIIKSINEFFHIIMDPKGPYYSYIYDDKHFDLFPGNVNGLSPEEVEKFNQLQNQPIKGLAAPFADLNYRNIASKDNFIGWLKEKTKQPEVPNVDAYIQELLRQLSLLLNKQKMQSNQLSNPSIKGTNA